MNAALATVAAKKRLTRLVDVRFEALDEDRCVQTLHIGSDDDEAPVLAELHDVVIPNAGLRMTGKHHGTYLSNARKTGPSKLRTILRQPVARVTALPK